VNYFLLGSLAVLVIMIFVMLPRINAMKKLEDKHVGALQANFSGSVIGLLLAFGVVIVMAAMSTEQPIGTRGTFLCTVGSLVLVSIAALWLWFQSKIKLDCEEVVYET
jgi:hypothetical protein